ncbi:hypothetical protein K504DRAFT_75839 [Pleomassaria siparia CBS 279.74]|uniref:Uncharacterized protein n=1 Tax=Pleomassaria siparia CBS 279.74 TaxID=1314801 RepID=A0A6G1K133_9PLEO|nr:hypothetical protein K504DRAFT_75839 [Pleomassaria siparia CBS 279.74]
MGFSVEVEVRFNYNDGTQHRRQYFHRHRRRRRRCQLCIRLRSMIRSWLRSWLRCQRKHQPISIEPPSTTTTTTSSYGFELEFEFDPLTVHHPAPQDIQSLFSSTICSLTPDQEEEEEEEEENEDASTTDSTTTTCPPPPSSLSEGPEESAHGSGAHAPRWRRCGGLEWRLRPRSTGADGNNFQESNSDPSVGS